MKYAIVILPSARAALAKLPRRDRERIDQRILALADDQHPQGAIPLKGGSGLWRVRAGDYRILYKIQNERLVVIIVDVGNRREIYRGM